MAAPAARRRAALTRGLPRSSVQATRPKRLLPHLRASGGRLLTVSSVGGVVGQPFNEAYCAAKFAVEDFMEGLAPVAAAMGVHVALIEPGAVASEFVANVGADPGRLVAEAGPYSDALRGYLSRTSGAFANAQTSAAAAIVAVLDADAGVPLPDLRDGHRQFTGLKLADLDGMRVQGLTRTWIA